MGIISLLRTKVDFVMKSDEKGINLFIAPAGYIFRKVEPEIDNIKVRKPKLINVYDTKLIEQE